MSDEQKPVTLEDLKKEVIEGRNLVIKTDNLLKTLHAELKQVAKLQEEFEQRQWRGSAAAYGLFVALAGGGALLWANARLESSSAERHRLEIQVADLQHSVDGMKADASVARGASEQAAEAYRLMTTLSGDERLKGIDALAKVELGKVSALERKALEDQAATLKKEVGAAALDSGKAAFRRQDYVPAEAELTRYVHMSPGAEMTLELDYMLGVSLNQLKRHKEAIPHLSRSIREDRRNKGRDYAMLLLAQSLEATGDLEKAMELAREAIGQYPNSDYLPQFRSRLSSIKRAMTDGGTPAAVPESN